MKKILIVWAAMWLFFLLECLLFHLAGSWMKPNFLLLGVIYFSLFNGVRYGLLAALIAGVLRDSFGVYLFGSHLLVFVICAFLCVFLRRLLFQVRGHLLLAALTLMMSVIYFVLMYIIFSIQYPIELWDALLSVIFPEVFTTILVSAITYQHLRQCVLKFYA